MGWVDLVNIVLGETPKPKWTLELHAKWGWKPQSEVLTQKVLWSGVSPGENREILGRCVW